MRTSRRTTRRGRIHPLQTVENSSTTVCRRCASFPCESRSDAYGYNVRNELISASKTGGPTFSSASYAANNLNQYTSVSNCDSSALSRVSARGLYSRLRRRRQPDAYQDCNWNLVRDLHWREQADSLVLHPIKQFKQSKQSNNSFHVL